MMEADPIFRGHPTFQIEWFFFSTTPALADEVAKENTGEERSKHLI
jgi:hypothetical protein